MALVSSFIPDRALYRSSFFLCINSRSSKYYRGFVHQDPTSGEYVGWTMHGIWNSDRKTPHNENRHEHARDYDLFIAARAVEEKLQQKLNKRGYTSENTEGPLLQSTL